MRIAIDARPALDPKKTGVGQYAAQLIRHLPAADPDARYVAWCLPRRPRLRGRFFPEVREPNFSEHVWPVPARLAEPVTWRLGGPRVEWFLEFDALLATNFLPPPTGSRGVVLVVHDLAFRVVPETAPLIDARWLRRFRGWLGDAARVIVPSESTRRDLLSFEEVDPGKVVVVHHGVDAEAFRSARSEAVEGVRRRYGLTGRYLLFVGGLEPRKNVPALVRAFAAVDTDASLVVAGGRVRWHPRATDHVGAVVDALPGGVRDRVILSGYVSDADKVALLAGATALVYPSLYEGFGFPVLEGMAARVPVMTSTASSLPEVAGEAALLVDPSDQDAMAEGMRALLEDEDLRDRLIASGLARAATFTWQETAKRTAVVLREAGEAGRR